MIDILQPIGTVTCGFAFRVPTQTDANCHLNVDESMVLRSSADYVMANGVGRIFEVLLGPTTIVGPIPELKQAFFYKGNEITITPGGSYLFLLDGVPITTEKTIRQHTNLDEKTGQLVWLEDEILVSLTGEMWNAATTRSMRVTVADAGSLSDPPPWIQEQ